jgi:hypothetical protein
VLDDQRRRVSSTDVLLLQTEVTVQGLPFTYFGYYWRSPGHGSGDHLHESHAVREYRAEFEDFLNGLRVEQ